MPTYTNNRESSSRCGPTSCPRSQVFILYFAIFAISPTPVRSEDFAQPPQWTYEEKGVFFEDARKQLKGEPATHTESNTQNPSENQAAERAVWRELITQETLESAVKGKVLLLSHTLRSMQVPARSQEVSPTQCRRDFTILGTLFQVIDTYPGDVRWKSIASQLSQMCLKTAEFYAAETHTGIKTFAEAYSALEDALRGKADLSAEPNAEPLFPEFAPLMQWMKFTFEDWLPTALSKKADFRRNADSITQSAQMLAMLSQVIRGEEYGYADDETYQRHADKLRDAAKHLNEAAASKDFEKALEAATAIQKSCADCHADFRG
jgi:hypothetical protein